MCTPESTLRYMWMTPKPMVRYAFPVVFTAYVVAMHVGWSGYGPEDAT